LRRSRHIACAAIALPILAVGVCACSPRTLVLVDPDPCADGGVVRGVPGCAPPGLLDDLVGYWRLDDLPGSTTAQDWPGRRNDGTLVDLVPATAWVAGRAAGGLAVGAAGYVTVAPSVSIDSITDQVTLAGWGYLDATTPIMDFATIASRQFQTGIEQHYHISINMRGEVATFFVKTETADAMRSAATPVARQTWFHIAGTYDGTTARLYVDGVEVSNQPLTGRFVPDTTPIILGANGNDADVSERFPGRIDEIMLYRRALSAEEIAMLHDGALFATPINPDGGARD
jgi:hypothetical protein